MTTNQDELDAQAWRLHQAQELIERRNADKTPEPEPTPLIGVVMPPVPEPKPADDTVTVSGQTYKIASSRSVEFVPAQ